jgi:hypothetical protein
MTARPSAALLVLVALVSQGPANAQDAAGEKVQLRVQLPKDAHLRFKQSMSMTQAMKMGEMDMDIKMDSSQEVRVKVLEVDPDGSFLLEVRTGTVKGKMESPMMEFEFDSSKKDEEGENNPMSGMMSKAMTGLANRTFKVKLGADGEVREVQGAEDVVKSVFSEDVPGLGMMKRMMGEQFSVDGIRHQIQGYFLRLPKEPVGVGGAWPTRDEMSLSGQRMVTETNQKVTSVGPEQVEVSLTGKMELKQQPADAKKAPPTEPGKEGEEDEEAAAEAAMAMFEKMKIADAVVKGDARISRKDGLPLSEKKTISYEMTMPSPMGGEDAEEMVLKTSLQFRVERLPDAPEESADKPSDPPPPKKEK